MPNRAHQPLSTEELMLLNEEVRALVRAGIPLDLGLAGSAARLNGRLGRITERLARHVGGGATLVDALEAEGNAFPPAYRAIIAAGLRTGRFDEVLRRVSEYAAISTDLRATLRRSVIYPAAILCIGYALFVLVISVYLRQVEAVYDDLRQPVPGWMAPLFWLRESVHLWGPGIPVLLLVLWLAPPLLGLFGGPATGRLGGLFGWLPGVVGANRLAALSRFSHLLALLVDFAVPLPEAARISAAASGDKRLAEEADHLASRIEAGDNLASALAGRRRFPAFLRWLLVSGQRRDALAATLRQAGDVYALRAEQRLLFLRRVVPPLLTVVVGGGLTCGYVLTVFAPLTSMWEALARP